MRQHSIDPTRLEIIALPRFPPHHFIDPVTLRQLRQPHAIQRRVLGERRDVFDAFEGRVDEGVRVVTGGGGIERSRR